jgi:CheY-like chemotaxis protein
MTVSAMRGASEAARAEGLCGARILLVEDSWHAGMALADLLRALGAEVAGPAATVADAERLAADCAPDIAIVDFSLRGHECADDLIDRLHARGTRVVVLSGYEVLPAQAPNAVAVLNKPVSEPLLLATLRPLIARKSAD